MLSAMRMGPHFCPSMQPLTHSRCTGNTCYVPGAVLRADDPNLTSQRPKVRNEEHEVVLGNSTKSIYFNRISSIIIYALY